MHHEKNRQLILVPVNLIDQPGIDTRCYHLPDSLELSADEIERLTTDPARVAECCAWEYCGGNGRGRVHTWLLEPNEEMPVYLTKRVDGRYEVDRDGRHRVCYAKRSGITSQILASVYVQSVDDDSYVLPPIEGPSTLTATIHLRNEKPWEGDELLVSVADGGWQIARLEVRRQFGTWAPFQHRFPDLGLHAPNVSAFRAHVTASRRILGILGPKLHTVQVEATGPATTAMALARYEEGKPVDFHVVSRTHGWMRHQWHSTVSKASPAAQKACVHFLPYR